MQSECVPGFISRKTSRETITALFIPVSGKDGRRHGACSGTPETFIEASLLQAVCAWDIRPLLASICGSCSSLCVANRGCFVPMCVSASVGSTPFHIASGGFVGRRGPPFLAFEEAKPSCEVLRSSFNSVIMLVVFVVVIYCLANQRMSVIQADV